MSLSSQEAAQKDVKHLNEMNAVLKEQIELLKRTLELEREKAKAELMRIREDRCR